MKDYFLLKYIIILLLVCQKEKQGWRSGESTHLPPIWPGFNSQFICGLSLLFVLALSTETNIPKFQFDLEIVDERATLCEALKFPFIDLFLFIY